MQQLHIESKSKHLMSRGMQMVFEHPSLYNTALRFAPLANHLPHCMIQNAWNAWGAEREMPQFAAHTFNELYHNENQSNHGNKQ